MPIIRRTHICKSCGIEYTNRKKTSLYCSNACYNTVRQVSVEKICAHCGKSKWLPAAYGAKEFKRHFCDWECRVAYGMVKSICKGCGKEFEHKRYAKRLYCSNACVAPGTAEQRRKHEKKICVECGKSFYAQSSAAGLYCSLKCYERVCAATRTEAACALCGQVFTTSKLVPKIYCSHHCRQQASQKKESRTCLQCGQPFLCVPSARKRFCDRQCVFAFRRIEDSRARYGPAWPLIRDEIRERDNYLCVGCGAPENGRAHDVHHIVPLRQFSGDLEAAHQPRNLISLCRSCHSLVEVGHLLPQLPLIME